MPGTTPAPTSSTATDPFASLARDDLKQHIQANGYKTVEDLAFADMNARRMLGFDKAQILRVPRDPNDAEGWAAVRKAIGVPEKPDGYGQFQPATGALAVAPEQLSALDKAMHEAGAPPAARNAALKVYHDLTQKAEADIEAQWTEQVNTGLAALKSEWGGAYEQNLTAGAQAAKTVLGEDFVKFLADAKMDDHPLVKRAFHKLAAMTREDRPPVPAPGGPAIGREEAERKIAEMRKNPALNNSADPDHHRILAEWKRLHDLAYGA